MASPWRPPSPSNDGAPKVRLIWAAFGKDGKREGSAGCHCVFKCLVLLPVGRVDASFPGLCPRARHFGDRSAGEPAKLFPGARSQYSEPSPGEDDGSAGLLLPLGRPQRIVVRCDGPGSVSLSLLCL